MRGLTQFEHRRQKVIPRMTFATRMARAMGLWFALTLAGLLIGMAGYAATEGMGAADAFVNAAITFLAVGALVLAYFADQALR